MKTTHYDEIAEQFAAIADVMPGNAFYERPATLSLLPPLAGLDVLDAGCGTGFYSKHAADAGARVVAFDPSVEMTKRAEERLQGNGDVYHCETKELGGLLGGRQFDLILSCLVLHYVRNIRAEFALLADLLKPDGKMVVSMKHPFINQDAIKRAGYRTRSFVTIPWGRMGTMTTIQRPLSQITRAIHAAGLYIDELHEPLPGPELKTVAPAQYKEAMHIPFFIHFVLGKRPVQVRA